MKIDLETTVASDLDTVWAAWTNPADIKRWNAASEDWHTTECSVDLREGGTFTARMEAKDGSMGFDFKGTYKRVVERESIEYVLDDGRGVQVEFGKSEDGVRVRESFETESETDAETQRQGWQAILDNFARYVEGKRG